jgi:hypothetical protein
MAKNRKFTSNLLFTNNIWFGLLFWDRGKLALKM